MATYLLVAHQTAESPELLSAAQDLKRQDEGARFVLLVPTTPVEHMLVWEEGETRELARSAADRASARMREAGLDVVAVDIGDPDPVQAIDDELRSRRHDYAAIVLSTHPPGASRWLRMDVPSRVERRHPKKKIVHVTSEVRSGAPPGGRSRGTEAR